MALTNLSLNNYACNITSQYGEDGIIQKALEVIGDHNNWCVEFGAGYGKADSNTFNLITNHNYSAVLIEPKKRAFNYLKQEYRNNSRVILVNKYVGFDASNNLDYLLKKYGSNIPINPDILSIDIDGNDYHVWAASNIYRPKLVIIEFNPTIPDNIEFVQEKNFKVSQGSSLLSINKLAIDKGYQLIAVTRVNAIYADERFFHLFNIQDNSIAALRKDRSDITEIFSGYDGTIFMRGSRKLPWHNIFYNEAQMQQLPKCLRDFPENYGRVKRKILFPLYQFFRHKCCFKK